LGVAGAGVGGVVDGVGVVGAGVVVSCASVTATNAANRSVTAMDCISFLKN